MAEKKSRKGIGGRPRIHKTPADLRKAIDDYMTLVEEEDKSPTYAGFTLALGYESHKSLYDLLARDDEFSTEIKKGLTRLAAHWEGKLGRGSPVGAIFWLKNRVPDLWKDKTESDVNVSASDEIFALLNGSKGLPGDE